MKKMKFRAVALCAAAVMAVSFASCSVNITTDSSASSASSESSTEATIPNIDSVMDMYKYLESKTEDNKYKSMQEFVESVEFAGIIESLTTVAAQQGLSLGIGADGDCLVYEYKYNEQIEVNDEVKKQISDEVESFSDTTQSNLELIKDYVDIENPSIKYVYLNADETEIYSKTFTLGE